MADALPWRMYTDLAPWWPLLSDPEDEDYAAEAEYVRRELSARGVAAGAPLLELGSGGGNMARHLKAHFALTLVDLSPDMLAVSRRLNPELEHHVGDMRRVALGRRFGALMVHDAVTYLTRAEDLAALFANGARHLLPGGVMIVLPDDTVEIFQPKTDHGGEDAADGSGRAMRYLEWSWDDDPTDTESTALYVLACRDTDGSVRVVEDRHTQGLFPRATWLAAIAAAGMAAERIEDPWGRDVFIGLLPGPEPDHGAAP